jgi:glutamate carboxypeptidase
MQPLLEFTGRRLDATVAAIGRLVRLESPSTDKAAVDRCGRELVQLLRDTGVSAEPVAQRERGDHIRARLPGAGARADAARPVLLLGHFDTVWPVGTLERMPFHREGNRLYGPGTFDMKAGIAIAIAAVAALRETGTPHPPLEMLWTSDEEIGSATSRHLIEAVAAAAAAVLVLEPALPGGGLKTARKGCGEFTLTVHGVAAHAGLDPGKGASAIHELAQQIAAIERLQDLPHGISVNVGIVSGGSRPNVVAEEARAVIDVRAPTREGAERVEAALRALQPARPGTRLTIEGAFDRPPMERTSAVARLFGIAAEVAATLGGTLREGSAGGGSDGNFTAALGVPTLDGLGAAGDGAHAAHEHVDLDTLAFRVALVAGIIARL